MKTIIGKKFEVKIHPATLSYIGRKLSGISTELFWEARGLTGTGETVINQIK